MRVILVDDEPLALEYLRYQLQDYPDVEILAEFDQAVLFLEAAPDLKPDVVFLDIQMPGMTGLELASRLNDLMPDVQVVFVTAYSSYALEAFELNALSYLVKPVQPEKLAKTIQRVRQFQPAGQTQLPESLANWAIYLFGRFQVRRINQPSINWTTGKVEELLAILLLHPEGADKWQVSEMLWPGATPKKAEQNLHTTIYRLKRDSYLNGLPVSVDVRKSIYSLAKRENIPCDYDLFRQTVAKSSDKQVRAAFEAYTGDLLAEKDYAWADQFRFDASIHYREIALARLQTELQNPEDSTKVLESLHRLMLQAYRISGNDPILQSQFLKWARQSQLPGLVNWIDQLP